MTSTHSWSKRRRSPRFEHAIVLRRYSNGVTLQQRDQEITVPLYAVRALLRELRDIAKDPDHGE